MTIDLIYVHSICAAVEAVTYAKEQTQKTASGCFVASTLVHTKEGLWPIEQIKVGDFVLSKPESGEEEQSYQPVNRTFIYENREMYLIGMNERDKVTGNAVRYQTEYFAVSGAHPIWIDYFEQLNFQGDEAVVTPVNAWVTVEDYHLRCWQGALNSSAEKPTAPDAYSVLANGSPVVFRAPTRILKGLKPDEGMRFRDHSEAWSEGCIGSTVYNIEIANTHTYFVGEPGLWVHNKNTSIVPRQMTLEWPNPRGYQGWRCLLQPTQFLTLPMANHFYDSSTIRFKTPSPRRHPRRRIHPHGDGPDLRHGAG